MPIYEYQCKSCGNEVEVIQKVSDEPLKICPQCRKPIEKKMSLSSFSLKGNGWYSTDYKKSNTSEKKVSSGD
ncbi:MAG: FmdB family transcriptional regulator [Bdellovibrionaceae bacterium]|nr:FmdB family transcriptional regulator [Pseudobdellovibrionaceae bacterium]|tara:strand:+ start:191 stop:406 length:216 start_codon:yes stop_codon:yes gene_type:complete